ncbi:MAG: hypothetical protein IJ091_02780 [Oscillospiraceae bacterium]|nr:hypothetical protein [Oscillospiraceae bacterium]
MRKMLVCSACLLLLFLLAGCGNVNSREETEVSGDPNKGSSDGAEEVRSYPFTVAYANYADDPLMLSKCLNGESVRSDPANHIPVYRIEDTSELSSFVKDFHNIFTLDHGYNEVSSFADATLPYDDNFFSSQSLLIAYVSASSCSFRYGLKEILVENNEIQVKVEQTNDPEAYDTAMAGWFVIAEIPEADLEGCDRFDAVIEHKLADGKPALTGHLVFGEFSWKEVQRAVADLDEESLKRVKTEGFVNTDEITLELPEERAKAEVTIDYDLLQYYYDGDEDMWMVRFFHSGQAGDVEEVYLDGKGVTRLIIYATQETYG